MRSTASRLITGNAPGCPINTGQTLTLGCFSRGSLRHPQNILCLVLSSAWTSKPITGSYSIPLYYKCFLARINGLYIKYTYMLSYNDLKKGTLFMLDAQPYEVLEYNFVRMQQRRPTAQTK